MNRIRCESKFDSKSRGNFFKCYYIHRSKTAYIYIVLFIVLVIMAISQMISGTASTSSVIVGWSMCGIIGIIMPVVLVGRCNSAIRQEARELGDKVEVIEFSKDKISVAVQGMKTNVYAWKVIEQVYESKQEIFLFGAQDSGFVIKKSDIVGGEEALEALIRIIKANIPQGKKGPKYKKLYK